MIKIIQVFLLACLLTVRLCPAENAQPLKVKVLKDNTNLRAKASLNAEVAGQAASGSELVARGMDASWVEVVAPTNVDLWLLGEYIGADGIVCAKTVNVRSGPGINFSVVGRLEKGAAVERRGSLGDWIKIAPPSNCTLWVARDLVEIVAAKAVPASPVPAAAMASRPAYAAAEPARPTKPVQPPVASAPPPPRAEPQGVPAAPPAGLDLIPNTGQGQVKEFAGTLKLRNFLVRSPAGFRLVVYDAEGHSQVVCYVKGNREQLDKLLYRELVISGRQYWVHGCRQPVVVPERIMVK